MLPLPIDAVVPAVIAGLRTSGSAVLKAPAGAGKTTRVPSALLDSGLVGNSQIIVVQPRRIAARTVARRMALERGGRVGEEVGYHVRFDCQANRKTRLVVMTEGILIRQLRDDPFLEGIGAVVIDEFHERHLDTDLSLAMVRRVQQTVRPDLKLLVMSATLQAEPIAAYLGSCPIVESQGSTFPVSIRHQESAPQIPVAVHVARATESLIQQTTGHILVFLPGTREIRQAQEELNRLILPAEHLVLPLSGDLSPAEQDRVFQDSKARKIILATNVAETSITIPGVTAVVDTGTARILEFDPESGLNRLQLKQISRASAEQRAGRAGRTEPGTCIRLWPEAAHRHRPERESPEIHRVDLSGVVLQLFDWGESDLSEFPWFDPPGTGAVEQAQILLRRLGAIDDSGITAMGRLIARLPLEPRLARLLIEGASTGDIGRAAIAASLLNERDPFLRSGRNEAARHRSLSDVMDRVDAMIEHARSGRTDFDIGVIHRNGAHTILRTADQLERELSNLPGFRNRGTARTTARTDEALLKAILAAYPDRLVRRRSPGDRRGLMVGGRGVRLSEQSAVTEGDLFVCVEADAGATEAFVRQASFVDRDWLSGENLETRIDVEFDLDHERVQARRRVLWDGLVLEESTAPLPDDDRVASKLSAAAVEAWDRVYPRDDAELSQLISRIRCLAQWMPDLQLPDFDEEFLKTLVPELCFGRRSFAELKSADWSSLVRSHLTPHQLQMVEREAPERIGVPSGSRIAIHYEFGRPPVLAVRIQEIFGWKATPRIAGGRIPLLLHLLAPNHRPQQITDDLTSFWSTAYPIIRGELRRRYPRHAWPEDPWNAEPERRPQPKKNR